jgi:hypothetical protein
VLEELHCLARAAAAEQLEAASALLVVIDEKSLDLVEQLGAQVLERLDVLVRMGMQRHGEEPIIARPAGR